MWGLPHPVPPCDRDGRPHLDAPIALSARGTPPVYRACKKRGQVSPPKRTWECGDEFGKMTTSGTRGCEIVGLLQKKVDGDEASPSQIKLSPSRIFVRAAYSTATASPPAHLLFCSRDIPGMVPKANRTIKKPRKKVHRRWRGVDFRPPLTCRGIQDS